MIRFLLVLFIVGTLVLVVRIFLWGITSRAMPWSCPRCSWGTDTDFAGEPRRWYVVLSDEHVRCRYCYTLFKEHPNGLLVEDRDS